MTQSMNLALGVNFNLLKTNLAAVLNEFIFLGVHGTPTLEKRKYKKH